MGGLGKIADEKSLDIIHQFLGTVKPENMYLLCSTLTTLQDITSIRSIEKLEAYRSDNKIKLSNYYFKFIGEVINTIKRYNLSHESKVVLMKEKLFSIQSVEYGWAFRKIKKMSNKEMIPLLREYSKEYKNSGSSNYTKSLYLRDQLGDQSFDEDELKKMNKPEKEIDDKYRREDFLWAKKERKRKQVVINDF